MISAGLRAFAERALGDFEVAADCSWEHRASAVLRLHAADGTSWYLKRHSEPERYAAERHAYRAWVPALKDRAPQLLAASDELNALLLSEVPGRSAIPDGIGRTPAVQHQAGQLLRTFHGSAEFPLWTDFAVEKSDEVERYLAGGLIPRHAADFVRSELREFDGVTPERVPCHLDYNLRNWIVHDGRLSVVDFEWARPDAWLSDFTRLELQSWRDDPALREAFLDGYGRRPDEPLLRLCCTVNTIFLIVRAHEYGMTKFEAGNRVVLADLIGEGA
ncbi:MAG TPA: phosphotransferase [Mycobacteriales bacterium]|nr:phosphotransferase [Mycobacteriales bacterium]